MSSKTGLEGLGERRGGLRPRVIGKMGKCRDVDEAFVEEDFGETMDKEDEVEALEALRRRAP